MQKNYPADAWRLLNPRLTDTRREKMLAVARQRTSYLRLVIQDIHDPHNVSACLRSADAFGVLECDVVDRDFRSSTVARGTSGWLRLKRWDTIAACAASLKAQGFRVAAGFPDASAVSLESLPLDKPLAVIFGNEHAGVSPEWLPHIDTKFTIPMVGMVESLNISVSAAVTLFTLRQRAEREVTPAAFHLSDAAREELLNEWICRQVLTHEAELARLRERE